MLKYTSAHVIPLGEALQQPPVSLSKSQNAYGSVRDLRDLHTTHTSPPPLVSFSFSLWLHFLPNLPSQQLYLRHWLPRYSSNTADVTHMVFATAGLSAYSALGYFYGSLSSFRYWLRYRFLNKAFSYHYIKWQASTPPHTRSSLFPLPCFFLHSSYQHLMDHKFVICFFTPIPLHPEYPPVTEYTPTRVGTCFVHCCVPRA